MPRSKGRTGRRWRTARALCLARSRICWLCGHPGANEADHEPALVVLEELGLDPCDQRYLRPAHGTKACPDCGIKCNQAKGAGQRRRRRGPVRRGRARRRSKAPVLRTSQRW